MPEYTLTAIAAPLAVVAVELLVLRTGLFRDGRYWASLAIAFAFQVPVDGWLTRAGRPVVQYSAQATSGLRFPWDIPVEDFGFGFAIITATVVLWRWHGQRASARMARHDG
jgi:lycopene cyclase domain-containing protein